MKNLLFGCSIILLFLLACRSDDGSVQKIDQIIDLYIDSLGQDLLNSKIPGSYVSQQMNDVYGLTDNVPVNFSLKKDADTVNYIEYLAGAKRIVIDSSGIDKTYESKIALKLIKKVNDSTQSTTNDTLTIQYLSSPILFQVSKVFYNGTLKFTKIDGTPNVVKITK